MNFPPPPLRARPPNPDPLAHLAGAQAVVLLPVQYRMAADIMLLPNTLIYNNALRCGTGGQPMAAPTRAEACLLAGCVGPGVGCGGSELLHHLQGVLGRKRLLGWVSTVVCSPLCPHPTPGPLLLADSIAQGMLQLGPAAGAALATLPVWLQAALDPQRRAVFLDTALVEGARETGGGRLWRGCQIQV